MLGLLVSLVDHSVVGNGVVGNSVVGGMVDHRGGVVHGVVGNRGSVVDKGSVVGDSVVSNGVGNGVVSDGVVCNGDVGSVAEDDVLGGGEQLGSGRGRGHEGKESKGLKKSFLVIYSPQKSIILA